MPKPFRLMCCHGCPRRPDIKLIAFVGFKVGSSWQDLAKANRRILKEDSNLPGAVVVQDRRRNEMCFIASK